VLDQLLSVIAGRDVRLEHISLDVNIILESQCATRGGSVLGGGLVARVVDAYVVARFGKFQCDAAANASRAPGNECNRIQSARIVQNTVFSNKRKPARLYTFGVLRILRDMREVTVPLGTRSYLIRIAPKLLPTLGAECMALKLGKRCAIITDKHVAPLYAKTVEKSLRAAGFEPSTIVVPAGETAKSLKTVQACHDQLAKHRLERQSFIVALGGGVVGDLAGFVAATYLRGVAFVQVPTTLLAQVDSSVGGKVGVNLKAGKNLVGAFYQPRFVLCDLDTLKSLPPREYRAGLAEVIKYGIIYDAPLFARLERDLPKLLKLEPGTLGDVVARCCGIKAAVVGQDETEAGLRAILNFGHTIGHALEAISKYGKYLHGEAISIGQVAAAELSAALTDFSDLDAERVTDLFRRAGLPTSVELAPRQLNELFSAMRLDKKVSRGEIKFVLARRIGEVVWGQSVSEDLVRATLNSELSARS
jgi:3-dehydroquinate synthase